MAPSMNQCVVARGNDARVARLGDGSCEYRDTFKGMAPRATAPSDVSSCARARASWGPYRRTIFTRRIWVRVDRDNRDPSPRGTWRHEPRLAVLDPILPDGEPDIQTASVVIDVYRGIQTDVVILDSIREARFIPFEGLCPGWGRSVGA